jgi:hypothetical protein
MLTRRDVLRLVPAAFIGQAALATEAADFERIDTHVHIQRDAPSLFARLGDSRWSGLDPVICPTGKDEPFDLDAPRSRAGLIGPRWCRVCRRRG